MAGIKIDPEMLDIYLESLNKLMAGSETDGGNARLEVSGAGKTEDGLVRYNEEVNKLGDDLRELYGNVGEILGRIRDGTLFKNADKVSVVARSTDDAGVLAKHADEAAAWLHGVKVFRYSDETAEAVASGEKLLKESETIYESFADMMSPEDAKRYLDFLENGSREGLTSAELADALLVSQKVGYEDVWDLRNAGDLLESGINSIDDIALKHSSVGDFTYNPKTGQISRMKGGGHGQSNINFLEENGIEHNIVKEYDNGVRVGNVPKHKTPSKRTGTGQAWFPKNWSDSKIKEAGNYVTNLPDNKNLPDGVIGYGEYDGVRVGIIKTDGKIGTIFPDADLQP